MVGLTPPSVHQPTPLAQLTAWRTIRAMETLTLPQPSPIPPTAPPNTLVRGTDLTRVWGRGDGAQIAVDNVTIALWPGQLTALVGPSGSGKSTLGALLAGIDRPSAGSVVVAGTRIDRLSEDRLAKWRGANVGIVFQDFHLLPTLTAVENVELGLKLGGVRRRRGSIAGEALASVGLAHKASRLPAQLSGGEQQRVAIARAMAGRKPLLVADEPTGSLDTEAGRVVFDHIRAMTAQGTGVLLITHDAALAAAADRQITMVDGRIIDDSATDPTVSQT
jgi:putative ABC transport system ATP-binding protein